MTDFLLELRSEEIPARMQDKARDDFARLFTAELAKAGLSAAAIVTYATPRRLALIARDLPPETLAVSEEVKGPKTSAPPQALDGFLRKTGLTREQLVERDGIFFAITEKPGRATASVLAEAIPAIIRAFPWPKSMRWGGASTSTESLRWVRPLHGIVALLGETIVPIEIAGITSSAITYGHRFHHPGPITIGSAADYVEKLRACHVIVDQAERQSIIALGATMAAAKAGLTLVRDEGLLIENAGLTEWPVPLLGRFDEQFLTVPPEVIQLTARVNQKYFVCRDAAGNLANAFVCTANIDAHDDGAKIVEGNRKVLAARLADARFFYDTDLKIPLDDLRPKLEKIVFHERLGTVADKVDRVAKLARWLVEEGIVRGWPSRVRGLGEGLSANGEPSAAEGETLASQAERAARLAKADLVTGMVGEFPELQGLMGGYYAAAQGEDPAVAAAIRDHYKPVGQGDDVPTDPVTVAVSLADKLDTVASFFAIGELPTGSKDPFALRRAALGILLLIERSSLRLRLHQAFDFAVGEVAQSFGYTVAMRIGGDLAAVFDKTARDFASTRELIQSLLHDERVGVHEDNPVVAAFLESSNRATPALLSFFADRLKVQQREAGVRHDLIDAVFALGGEDDLVRLLARVRALQAFVTTEDGTNLLAGYKRAANILKKENVTFDEGDGVLSYTPEPAEAALHAALDTAEPAAANAVAREDFEAAMAALATLRAPIDAFFDTVTVNDADPAKRTARLALLTRVRAAVHTVADFSKIEG
ncbi:glycine--tRNA ligase subunit beta [Sphingomonas sp. Leaf339]|uniref:glycine--tRNA ligase subunit beta n=1 Tax=Sphingomonas sp. Leaf339 TaxID=1736343 RepID=UPI0006FA0682|nr:glycine--tRNA ligase subunit beta [Sphingomonas sp. Leaf339]KQU62217.1 glycine--tRNA ligase subunit beta [Sphingomonas sp. Leaf339]